MAINPSNRIDKRGNSAFHQSKGKPNFTGNARARGNEGGRPHVTAARRIEIEFIVIIPRR